MLTYIFTKLKDAFFEVKWFFQRVFRGYSDTDMADFSEFLLGKKILPYLKIWVNKKHYGYPAELDSYKEWETIINEILWSVEEMVTHKNEDRIFDEFHVDGDEEKFKKAIHDNWERASKGMELFGKYVTAMWD